jgi:DNA-directed RNA polymerase specialized sigma24 family protein
MEPRSNRHDDDLALARHAAEGDREAFAAFFERHFDAVFAFATRGLRDELAAERLTEEILGAAVEALGDYTGDAPLAAWVLAIARSAAGARPEASTGRAVAHP